MDFNNLNLEELNNLSKEEREAVLKILKEYSLDGMSEYLNKLKYIDFDEIPVDIDTFLHDKKYLGNALYDADGRFTVFPYWEKKLKEIFPDNITTAYNTIILTGAIGLGKSTIAVICLLYLLYRLLCLKDPYLYYGLQPIDKITISLMNITIDNAKGVALDKLNQMILTSEWFMAHGEMRGTTNLEYAPNKHIELITASSNNQVIGRAVFANFSDEVNWGITNDTEKLKKKYKQLVSQIDARMKSRFMRQKGDTTYLPTLNIIASSKNSEQSFLEDYIQTKKKTESTNTLIVDEPQWVVDSRKDSATKFYVAIGNRFLANELLPLSTTKEELSYFRAKGYNILEVPIGYLENFRENIDGALMDIAGIATASSLKFISGVRWEEAKVDNYKNPFTKDVIEVGTGDDFQYKDFFDLSRVPDNLKSKPLFIHLDMSTGGKGKGDKTGIGGVWMVGKRPKVEGEDSSRELYFKVAFSVSVKAPRGFDISFDKNRQFIRWLREQGFNVRGVSSDTFMAAQIQQQLSADRFNVSTISVDRLDTQTHQCLPYAYFKSTLYDKRVEVYKDCDLLTEEVLGLERESDGHINHPKNGTQGCFTGDTKVSLVDGRELTFLELIDEFNNGKQNYVYSFNHTTKRIEPKLITNAWCTKKNAQLVEVELDNGEKLRCTPNHKFMLRDGSYCEAQYLIEGDSLMPLYRKYPTDVVSMKKYRMYYEPIEDVWHYEHRQFAQDVLDEKYLVHHKDCNPNNNNPTNLVWCSKSRHQQIHKELSTGAHSEKANEKRKQSLKNWYKDESNSEILESKRLKLHKAGLRQHNHTEQDYLDRLQRIENQHKRGEEIKLNVQINKDNKLRYIKEIEETFNVVWDNLSNNEKDSYAVKMQRIKHPETTKLVADKVSENHKLGKYDNAKSALKNSNDESKRLKELIPTVDKDKFYEIFGIDFDGLESKYKPAYTVKYRRILSKEILNHKVRSIKFLDTKEDVYDITVQDNHNFALSSGVFVHNSKDQVDGIVGALWNASQNAEEFAYEFGESLEAIVNVNNGVFDKQKAMQEELNKMMSARYLNVDGKDNGLLMPKTPDKKVQATVNFQNIANGIMVW